MSHVTKTKKVYLDSLIERIAQSSSLDHMAFSIQFNNEENLTVVWNFGKAVL